MSTGNTQPQPPPVPGYAPAPEAAQFDPWAKYTVVMKPGSTTLQMCATFNAGLAGSVGAPVEVCYDVAVPEEAAPAGVVVDPAVLAASAVARLSVPQPAITLSPQPSDNQWGALAVGLPIWAWASDPGPVTTAVTEQGIDIQMTATRGSVRFDWGDGTSSCLHGDAAASRSHEPVDTVTRLRAHLPAPRRLHHHSDRRLGRDVAGSRPVRHPAADVEQHRHRSRSASSCQSSSAEDARVTPAA